MTRNEILAGILAHLEAERYAPPTPEITEARRPPKLQPITPEQAAENLAILADATSGDPVVVAWREREAS